MPERKNVKNMVKKAQEPVSSSQKGSLFYKIQCLEGEAIQIVSLFWVWLGGKGLPA